MIKSSPILNLSEVGKTNYVHSEKEEQVIREHVRCTNEVLEALEIDKGAVLLRKKALRSDLVRYNIALSPIKHLTRDILLTIFELHCQSQPPASLPFRSKPPQLALSHVCSAWRQAVLDLRKLWSNISIALSRSSVRFEKRLEIANVWLSRAKRLPCSVEFQDFKWFDEHGQIDWQQDWHPNIVKNFLSQHKFKSLDVIFADHHLRDLLQLPDENLTSVQHLCVQHVDLEDDNQSELDFQKLINLTSFSLLPNPLIWTRTGEYVPVHIPKFANVAWNQLRHIELRVDVSVLFCLTVLEKSSAVLETCSFVISDTAVSFSREPICCSRLRKFVVDVSSSDAGKSLDPFLLSLRLPNLKSLTLGSQEYPQMPIGPQTLIVAQRISGVPIEELVISGATSEIDVQVLLTEFSSLRCLELPRNIKITASTICELEDGIIGAKLEDLTIRDPGNLDILALLRMVKARSSETVDRSQQARATPFKSMVLECNNPYKIEFDEPVEEIRKLGVSIRMGYLPDLPDEGSEEDYRSDYVDGIEYVHDEPDIDIEMYEMYGVYY